MILSAPAVQGVQYPVQGFSATPAQPKALCRKGFGPLCKACRAFARVYVNAPHAHARPARARYARVYAPLHTLHTLHKAVLVRVSAVQGPLTPLARPAQAHFPC